MQENIAIIKKSAQNIYPSKNYPFPNQKNHDSARINADYDYW